MVFILIGFMNNHLMNDQNRYNTETDLQKDVKHDLDHGWAFKEKSIFRIDV